MSAGVNKVEGGVARKGSSGGGALMMVLFSVTIFVSAALLFLVEPMFAKFVLPLYGSTPAVWTGSMMFFQAALLTSYLYVHLTTTWLGARRQAVVHLVVVLLPLLVLPLAVPGAESGPSATGYPLLELLTLMFLAVGLPFFAISATNPLIQRWLADTDHPAAKDPYFLYRASNLGSVIGLLGYPFLVEPSLVLNNQGLYWSVAYGLLVLLVVGSAAVLWRSSPASDATVREDEDAAEEAAAPNPPVGSGGGAPEAASSEPGSSLGDSLSAGMSSAPTILRRLRWIALAFVPSSLMLGVTAFITTDVTPIPLLWVLPLSLYLFSFVIVFGRGQRMPDIVHKVMVVAFPVVMAVLTLAVLLEWRSPFLLIIGLHLVGFFVVAMVMHGELARDRPPARHLTEFYLWVSVGGVLGGIFNALIVPVMFETVIEYPLVIVAACLLLPGALLGRLLQQNRSTGESEGSRRRAPLPLILDVALPLVLGLAAWGLLTGVESLYGGEEQQGALEAARNGLVGVVVAICVYFAYGSARGLRFGLGIAALVVAYSLATASPALFEGRSFFGAYTVSGSDEYHSLSHGNTNHGAQFLAQSPPEPITYYARSGPVGQLFDALPNGGAMERAAMIGLGTGSMACHNRDGQNWDFYEIDPLIEQIARDPNLFTYLRDCPGENEVTLGDARLSIQDAPDGEYGMILADAFSSDAIPVHLLTREATDLYLEKLQEDGVLMFHISNRHLELEPVLGNLAQDRGLTCYAQYDQEDENEPLKLGSHWVTMARDGADLGTVPEDSRWAPCATDDSDVWTDDFSNLLQTFDWGE